MRTQRGFSLIELMIIVVVIGILCAVAIPALMSAAERGKQKRTMADMRTLGTAIDVYHSDHNCYPSQSTAGPLAAVVGMIQPTYVRAAPVTDAWAGGYVYVSDPSGGHYTLTSYGKDNVQSGPASGPTQYFTDDIIMNDGSFVAWPDGVQND